MIPTENGQTVHFQVLKHLNLSSALWKTTRKTYIFNFCNFKKQPQKGCFWALKIPKGREPELYQGLRYTFYIVLNSNLNVLPENAPFVHFQWVSQPLRRFRAKPGWWWNVGLIIFSIFFSKFFSIFFCSKIHFYQMLITFPLFFLNFRSYWGAWESWDLVIFPRFSIFY